MSDQSDKTIKLKLTSEFDPSGIDEAQKQLDKTAKEAEKIAPPLQSLPETLDESTKSAKGLGNGIGFVQGMLDKCAGTIGKLFGYAAALNQVVELGIKLRNWIKADDIKAAEERAKKAEEEAKALEELNKQLADFNTLQKEAAQQKAKDTISAQIAKNYADAHAHALAIAELQSREQMIEAKREDDAFKLAQARLELKYKEGKITDKEFEASATKLKYDKERATLARSEADGAAGISAQEQAIKDLQQSVANDSNRVRQIDALMAGLTTLDEFKNLLAQIQKDASDRKVLEADIAKAKKTYDDGLARSKRGDTNMNYVPLEQYAARLAEAERKLQEYDQSSPVVGRRNTAAGIAEGVTGDASTDISTLTQAVELLLTERNKKAKSIIDIEGDPSQEGDGQLATAMTELQKLIAKQNALLELNAQSRSTLSQQEDIERRGQAATYQRAQAEADAAAQSAALKDRATQAEAKLKEAEAKAKESQAAYLALHASASDQLAAAAYKKLMGSGADGAGQLAVQALKGANLDQLVGASSPLYQLLQTLQASRSNASTRELVKAGNTYANDFEQYGRTRRQSRTATQNSNTYDTRRQQQQQQQQQQDRQTNDRLYQGNANATTKVQNELTTYLEHNTTTLTTLSSVVSQFTARLDRIDARLEDAKRYSA